MERPTEHLKFKERLDEAILSEGKIALPNVAAMESPLEALFAIGCASKMTVKPYRFKLMDFDPPLPSGQKYAVVYYPKIFINTKGMGGSFDGSGVILTMDGGKARVYSFAMCEHDWDESGANHSRGWHPKRCKKCGFDASIDSGD